MKNNLLFSFSAVIGIFTSYILIVSYDPIVPFLWSLLFIYLYGKNHLNIALNSYFILLLILYADKLHFDVIGIRSQFAYSSVTILMTFIFVFIYQELAGMKMKVATIFSYIVAFILYIVPVSYIIYGLNFDTQITDEAISAAAQTNIHESIEFITSSFSPLWLILIISIAIIIGYLLLKQEKKETEKIEKSLLSFIIIVFVSILLLHYKEIRLYNYVKQGTENYKNDLKRFKSTKEKRKVVHTDLQAEKTQQGETYIVIIGESLNKRHMGVYGYQRNTTPLLSEKNANGDLLLFDNAFSNHTHTMPVLSLALTEANQQNNKKYFDSFSIINILNQADFETYWITNQVLYGVWDNLVSIIAHDADHLISMNNTTGKRVSTQQHDGALISEVDKVLSKKSEKNRVIFVHLMGSHVDYTSRYPNDTYNIYDGALEKGEFGNLAGISWERRIKDLLKGRTGIKNFIREASGTQIDEINAYDNSIVYNDHVVGSILDLLEKYEGRTGLIYMSDHADDAISGLGHSESIFSYDMLQIPLIAWFSDSYKNHYKEKYHSFKENTGQLFSNDFFYDTLIGIFDINTTIYNPAFDLTSEHYNLEEEKALIFHGKKRYTDKNNHIWWQKANTEYLNSINRSSRVFPHRVNSTGKLKEIWRDGFRSFEVDTLFDNQSKQFTVGHNDGVMGMSLEAFLSSIDHTQLERIWLDFKNLDQNNYKQALERLAYLDQKFKIKEKFIVESHIRPVFHAFKTDGWYTSCYLSTATILKLLKENNPEKMKQYAHQLAKQTQDQKLSAVSFDSRLYPFVKQYLEPLITNDIDYHTWWGPDLFDADFKEKLEKNELFLDEHIKTILSRYRSKFDL